MNVFDGVVLTGWAVGYAVAQWLGIRLQMLGVIMVAGVAFIAVLEHHFNTVDPGVWVWLVDVGMGMVGERWRGS